MYNKYKIKNEIEIKNSHKNCGCLWFNWFKCKLLNIDPNIKFN